ncbi:hypothetical protein HAX54_008859, partial [Datura stramonium]|nr:hypothetical protein [Datura stramonium]
SWTTQAYLHFFLSICNSLPLVTACTKFVLFVMENDEVIRLRRQFFNPCRVEWGGAKE